MNPYISAPKNPLYFSLLFSPINIRYGYVDRNKSFLSSFFLTVRFSCCFLFFRISPRVEYIRDACETVCQSDCSLEIPQPAPPPLPYIRFPEAGAWHFSDVYHLCTAKVPFPLFPGTDARNDFRLSIPFLPDLHC